MATVAIIGFAAGLRNLELRRQRFLERAQYCVKRADSVGVPILEFIQPNSDEARRFREAIHREISSYREHFLRLASKYDRAAARPWLSVEPDPPEPSQPSFDALFDPVGPPVPRPELFDPMGPPAPN
jgi:hypothetical protein